MELTWKYLCWSLFLIKFNATLLKRDFNTGVLVWILENFWRTSVDNWLCNLNTTLQQTTLQKPLPNIAKQQQQEEEIYNIGQMVGDKFTKLGKIGFSLECFTADFLRFFTEKHQNLAFEWTAGYSPSRFLLSFNQWNKSTLKLKKSW